MSATSATIQKLEEDVAGHAIAPQLFALCTKALTNSPQPAVHAACQIQKLCQKLCQVQAGQAGQAERKRRFPDMFATPCFNHSVGKLPPRSSWAHLQATACSCSSQAVPSINDQTAKFRWDLFSICSPLQRSWEGQRYVLLTYGIIWICVFCLSTGTSKSHKMFLFPCNPPLQAANSTAVSV